MSEYTAADFAKARFAEHPDGNHVGETISLRDGILLRAPWRTEHCSYTDEQMADLGWKPVREAGGPEPHNAYLKANDVFRTKVEHLEGLLDEATSANESLRARNGDLRAANERLAERLEEESELARRLLIRNASLNGEVATLSRLAQDAKDWPDTIIAPGWGSGAKAAPPTLDSLREAWENAEPISEDNPANEGDELIAKLGDQEEYSVTPAEWDRPEFNAEHTVRVLHRAPRRPEWQGLADAIADSTHHPEPAGLAKALYAAGVRVITEGDESNE